MEEKQIKELISKGRAFVRYGYDKTGHTGYQTDQELKRPQPPLFKEAMGGEQTALPLDFIDLPRNNDLLEVINKRRSNRIYTQEKISLRQLSFLLWCSQGVKDIRGKSYATIRTVPCGGARHQFEVYLCVQDVEGLRDGLYHYLPASHSLEYLKEKEGLRDFITVSLEGQSWAGKANVIFYFSMVFYRVEWRYGIFAHRVALIDAGHISENLYLAATSLGLGCCAIGSVDGPVCDEAFGLDAENESIFYAASLGTIRQEDRQKEEDIYRFVHEQGL